MLKFSVRFVLLTSMVLLLRLVSVIGISTSTTASTSSTAVAELRSARRQPPKRASSSVTSSTASGQAFKASAAAHSAHNYHTSHALVFPPSSPSYFAQVVLSKSLRLLIIGGVNSSPSRITATVTSYIQHLQKWLEGHGVQSKAQLIAEHSYIRISPSNSNSTFLHQLLEQDIQRDILGVGDDDKWPNVLLLEHGQDCAEQTDFAMQCVYLTEQLLQRVFAAYDQQRLAHPDVFFVDILRVEKYYHVDKAWNATTLPPDIKHCQQQQQQPTAFTTKATLDEKQIHQRAKAFHIPDGATYNDRGSLYGMQLVEMARFYRYGVLSTSDAWYRSFVRHFLTHDICVPWPFLDEGHLLTAKGHESLFHMVKHFLEVVISSPRREYSAQPDTNTTSSVYCTDLRFGPPQIYRGILPPWRNFSTASNRLTEDYYKPTADEVHRSFVTTPSESWGRRIVEERSIRVLTLGGSNTADSDNYVDNFRLRLVNESLNPLAAVINVSDCYVANGGIPGWGPTVTKLPFETALPPAKWPNVIVMEYSVNCNADWICVQDIERVRSYYEALYSRHNVSMPDIVFLELFRAGAEIGPQPNCRDQQLLPEHNANYTQFVMKTPQDAKYQYHSRGSVFSMQLVEYARFYRLPIISFTDAFFPSSVRYIDSHSSCALWPFTRDNVHIRGEGEQFAIQLLFSFLKQRVHHHLLKSEKAVQSVSTPTVHLNQAAIKVEETLHIFGDYIYQSGNVIVQHRIWGPNIAPNERFLHTIVETHNFSTTYLQRHNDGKHQCIGSTMKGARLLLRTEAHPMYVFSFPEAAQPQLRFSLVLGVLHSWNRTYIGSLKCEVFPARAVEHNKVYVKASEVPIASQVIHAYEYNQQPIHDSTPRKIVLTKNLPMGPHIIDCENLDEGKLGCISSLGIYSN